MRVTGTNLIQGVINVSPNSPKARELRAWLSIVRGANWLGPGDVVASFANATSRDNVHWNFPLRASGGSIDAIVGFRGSGQVIVQQVN